MTAGLYVGQLIFAGIFDRHPGLRFCFAETRIGWGRKRAALFSWQRSASIYLDEMMRLKRGGV